MKKRSPLSVNEVIEDGNAVADVAKAKDYIKSFLELEDNENTNLANALSWATLAQVEQNDRYIKEEVDYLKNAISDEQQIQALKVELNNDHNDDDADGEHYFKVTSWHSGVTLVRQQICL